VIKLKLIIESTVGLYVPATIECEPHEAVGTVLNKAAASQGITDIESIALSFNGKVLENNRRIKEYGLKDGDTLQIVPAHRVQGSSPSPSISFTQNRILPQNLVNRLVREAKLVKARKLPIKMDLHNPLHWIMKIRGSGIWRGQDSLVDVYLSTRYPRVMPRILWRTHLVPKHPNIFPDTGWVCLTSLDPRNWNPSRTLVSIYEHLIYVMDSPKWEHIPEEPPLSTRVAHPRRNPRTRGSRWMQIVNGLLRR